MSQCLLMLSSRQGTIRQKENENIYLYFRISPVNQIDNNAGVVGVDSSIYFYKL